MTLTRVALLAAIASALILGGCKRADSDRYPPGYGVTPYPHATPLPQHGK